LKQKEFDQKVVHKEYFLGVTLLQVANEIFHDRYTSQNVTMKAEFLIINSRETMHTQKTKFNLFFYKKKW